MEEAIRTLDEGIKAARQLGEVAFEIARALNDLGTFYQDMYRLPKALACYSEAVTLIKAMLCFVANDHRLAQQRCSLAPP